ncbi:hypothetical protein COV17_03630 [Candidatus Woesearchaeota archaeon CG10_big_fil_rev_8_21_14_0_10_36_11]|nr:MAG: hypothetical protein COV17_03630 [Candidatus Woesearchaeota archaeon CG10_big_fil_rev_8_21_14_0_10_36_11]
MVNKKNDTIPCGYWKDVHGDVHTLPAGFWTDRDGVIRDRRDNPRLPDGRSSALDVFANLHASTSFPDLSGPESARIQEYRELAYSLIIICGGQAPSVVSPVSRSQGTEILTPAERNGCFTFGGLEVQLDKEEIDVSGKPQTFNRNSPPDCVPQLLQLAYATMCNSRESYFRTKFVASNKPAEVSILRTHYFPFSLLDKIDSDGDPIGRDIEVGPALMDHVLVGGTGVRRAYVTLMLLDGGRVISQLQKYGEGTERIIRADVFYKPVDGEEIKIVPLYEKEILF